MLYLFPLDAYRTMVNDALIDSFALTNQIIGTTILRFKISQIKISH